MAVSASSPALPSPTTAIVYAKTDMTKGNKGISAFVVDMKAPGVSCGKHEAKMGIIGYPTSDVVLEDVRVHKSDMLGKENMGFINAMKTLDGGRLGVSAQSIGVAQAASMRPSSTPRSASSSASPSARTRRLPS